MYRFKGGLFAILVFLIGSVTSSFAQYAMDYAFSMAGNVGNDTFAPENRKY